MEKLLELSPDLQRPIVATSSGFDQLHVGHLRCVLEAKKLGKTLIIIMNGDEFLIRKKRYQSVISTTAQRSGEILSPSQSRCQSRCLRDVNHVV